MFDIAQQDMIHRTITITRSACDSNYNILEGILLLWKVKTPAFHQKVSDSRYTKWWIHVRIISTSWLQRILPGPQGGFCIKIHSTNGIGAIIQMVPARQSWRCPLWQNRDGNIELPPPRMAWSFLMSMFSFFGGFVSLQSSKRSPIWEVSFWRGKTCLGDMKCLSAGVYRISVSILVGMHDEIHNS